MLVISPEDDLEVYNKFTEYYDIADDLNKEIEEDDNITLKQKQDVLYPIIDRIKELADELIENYIKHLKDKEDLDKLLLIKENIANILNEIDLFKNKVYELYKINDKNELA